MTRKITLGLMVFFAGILMSACGKKTTSNTTTNNNTGTSWVSDGNLASTSGCAAGQACSRYGSGTYSITNEDLYATSFGYNTTSQRQGAYIQCGNGEIPITWNSGERPSNAQWFVIILSNWDRIRTIFSGSTSEAIDGCDFGYRDVTTQAVNLASSYSANLQLNYSPTSSSHTLQSLAVTINDQVSNGNSQTIIFLPSSSANTYISQNGQYALEYTGNGRFIMGTQAGTEFGRLSITTLY